MNKRILLLGFLLPAFLFSVAQEGWVLKSDKDNIKSYSRPVENSKIKAVKLESVFSASVSQFVSALLDVASYDKWIYGSKSTRLVKTVSPTELFYYSQADFPWPTSDRDFVSHMILSQNPQSRVVRIDAKNVTGMVPLDSKMVRIINSVGGWVITPLGNNQIKVEYTLQVDPAGDLPGWLVNSFMFKGPVETFKSLREWIKKPQYASAHLPFIVN